jgi:hypothetical protein
MMAKGGPSHAEGGEVVIAPTSDIGKLPYAQVYATARCRVLHYRFPVPDGAYKVRVHFLQAVGGTTRNEAGLSVAANGTKIVESIRGVCGKEPAIATFDLSGWNSPPWGKSYTGVVQNSVDAAKAWWAKGGIVTMQLHWIHPGNPDGSAWRGVHGKKTASPPFDFAAALKSGTKANQELMRDLKGHADYLKQLADARVPVLWRPLHEIEGGWF